MAEAQSKILEALAELKKPEPEEDRVIAEIENGEHKENRVIGEVNAHGYRLLEKADNVNYYSLLEEQA